MDVAMELAERFAEYAGAHAADAKSLVARLGHELAPVSKGQPDTPIDLELSAQDRELVITATDGATTKRTTCPLPD